MAGRKVETMADETTTTKRQFVSFQDVRDIERWADGAGSHFFDVETMRFFRSKVLEGVYGGRYFITSEQFQDWQTGRRAPRRFTIREIRAWLDHRVSDGREIMACELSAVGEFQAYTTSRAARRAAEKLTA